MSKTKRTVTLIALLCVGSVVFLSCGSDAGERDSEKALTDDRNETLVDDKLSEAEPIEIDGYISPVSIDLKSKLAENEGAYVTSQCYTKTIDEAGRAHNPCFTCHTGGVAPNYVPDSNFQETNAFREYTKINRWSNLFKDRTDAVNAISDAQILQYVREDNYFDANGSIKLAQTLRALPETWDYDGDGRWDGYLPDCYFSFDPDGFDRTPGGEYSGWRAFGYYPFLGTFWPTNGSTDDVMIRLPEMFWQDENGTFVKEVYQVNLAVTEAYIKRADIELGFSVDEAKYGVDLDQNGTLGMADRIAYKWEKPAYDYVKRMPYNFAMHFVGRAYKKELDHELAIAPGLYPDGTEFLHSVRYLDVDTNASIRMAPRMKELRYAKKRAWNTYSQLQNATMSEIMQNDLFPERLRTITGNMEDGLSTGLGWIYQGFIEDKDGELRPQNYEETMFCIGCHSGIGAVVDSTFVFPRKFGADAFQNGWYHWSQDPDGLSGIKEPVLADGQYEYSLYLEANGAGDEFRGNEEVRENFFETNGSLIPSKLESLHRDISTLLLPSPERAMELNKAYFVIVREQSYIYGRDAHVKPVESVHRQLELDSSTGVDAVGMKRYPLQQ